MNKLNNTVSEVIHYLNEEQSKQPHLFSLPLMINKTIYTLNNYPTRLNGQQLFTYILNLIGDEKEFILEPGAEKVYKKIKLDLQKMILG